jgi:hypothetical protein
LSVGLKTDVNASNHRGPSPQDAFPQAAVDVLMVSNQGLCLPKCNFNLAKHDRRVKQWF